MGILDIFQPTESFQNKLDAIRAELQAVNENNIVAQKATELFEKYGKLFDDFQRDILEPRKIALAKELVATPDLPEHRDARLEIRGGYFEIESLITRRADAENQFHEFLKKKAKLLEERNEVETALKKRLQEETRRVTSNA